MDREVAPALKSYLLDVLAFEPTVDAVDIIHRRDQFRRADVDAEESPQPSHWTRERVREYLDALRTTFWRDANTPISIELPIRELAKMPELHRYVERLQAVATEREALLAIEASNTANPALFRALKTCVTATDSEASAVRDRFLSNLDKGNRRIRKAIRQIRKECPLIYSLEEEWFSEMSKHRRVDINVKQGSGYGIVFFFIIYYVLKLILSAR